jgi:hypothetical protein
MFLQVESHTCTEITILVQDDDCCSTTIETQDAWETRELLVATCGSTCRVHEGTLLCSLEKTTECIDCVGQIEIHRFLRIILLSGSCCDETSVGSKCYSVHRRIRDMDVAHPRLSMLK